MSDEREGDVKPACVVEAKSSFHVSEASFELQVPRARLFEERKKIKEARPTAFCNVKCIHQ